MSGRYEVIQGDDEGTFDVVYRRDNTHGDHYYFESWGSFATYAEALASIDNHKQRQRHH